MLSYYATGMYSPGNFTVLFLPEKTPQALYNVLRRLEQLSYLRKHRIHKSEHFSLGSLIYLLPKGVRLLAELWGISVEETGFRVISNPPGSINHAYHRMRLVDFWIALDNDLTDLPLELDFIATDWEREIRDGKQAAKTTLESSDGDVRLVPDITFIIKNTSGQEGLFWVEIDTAHETIVSRHLTKATSLLWKYLRYEKILADGGWKKHLETTANAGRVLTVTENGQHLDSIRRKVADHLKYKELFLFTTHEAVLKHGVLRSQHWFTLLSNNPISLL